MKRYGGGLWTTIHPEMAQACEKLHDENEDRKLESRVKRDLQIRFGIRFKGRPLPHKATK